MVDAAPAMPTPDIGSAPNAEIATDPAFAGFILLAKFLGVPADAAQLAHERGRGVER